jgi:hypothetical protein
MTTSRAPFAALAFLAYLLLELFQICVVCEYSQQSVPLYDGEPQGNRQSGPSPEIGKEWQERWPMERRPRGRERKSLKRMYTW